MKLPSQLNITLLEFAALLATRELLNSKAVRHNPNPTNAVAITPLHPADPNKPMFFNMARCGIKADCGTVACIGGHMALIMGRDPEEYTRFKRSKALQPLFFPAVEMDWNQISKKQAVLAIDYFLKTGKTNWKTILT